MLIGGLYRRACRTIEDTAPVTAAVQDAASTDYFNPCAEDQKNKLEGQYITVYAA